MNEFQTQLWHDLQVLIAEGDAFYSQDVTLDGTDYQIFNYRMASYTEFLKPGALECRGVMFEVDGDRPVRLACLPFHKFFNLNENPLTMDLDLSNVVDIAIKADGSLISSYIHVDDHCNHSLRLKSKGSIASTQALAAMAWLEQDEQAEFYADVRLMTEKGYTINMEWCAPDNRIVLGYERPALEVLSVRNMTTGQYLDPQHLRGDCALLGYWTNKVVVNNPMEFIRTVPAMTGIEGYVVQLPDIWFKIKTDWYLALHRLKDSINSPRRLFEAVLDEATDDLRASFHDDQLALRLIAEMEEFAVNLFNEMVKTVEKYYEANKELDRKEFAIKGQQELKRMYFGLAMQKYTGREPDYKAFLKKQWKVLGLKDVEKEDEEL